MEFSENIKVYFTYDTRNAVKCIHIYPCCPAAWHQNTVLACYNHVCYSGILIITILNQYLNHQQAIYTYTMDIFIHFPHPSSISLDNIPSCKEMPLCRLLLSGPSDISVIWRCSTTGVQKDTPAGRFWPREVLVWLSDSDDSTIGRLAEPHPVSLNGKYTQTSRYVEAGWCHWYGRLSPIRRVHQGWRTVHYSNFCTSLHVYYLKNKILLWKMCWTLKK